MTEVKFPSMVDMPDKEYFAHPAIDQTGLKKFMESPRAYAWHKLNPLDNSTLAFGKAAHRRRIQSTPGWRLAGREFSPFSAFRHSFQSFWCGLSSRTV